MDPSEEFPHQQQQARAEKKRNMEAGKDAPTDELAIEEGHRLGARRGALRAHVCAQTTSMRPNHTSAPKP